MCSFLLLYSSNLPSQSRITIWSLNAPGLFLSNDDQTLVIKRDRDEHNFGLKA